jgi:thymidylate synthase (FAD)
MNVRLISVTPDSENIIAYCARVSSPNQENPEIEKLLSYCIKHGHWSVFEMGDMCVEIETSRGIAAQILRHRSFNFQEFSQRYAKASKFELYGARRQDKKNRQNSIDDMSVEDQAWFMQSQHILNDMAINMYEEAIKKGIAKEQARFLLPLSVSTKMYMKGSIRSWIHYINVRQGPETQKEHRDIALAIKKIFVQQFPVIAKSLDWDKE